MNDKRKHAVIYCRVSSEKQVKEGHGLQSQEKSCRNYAEYHGYEVMEVFYDEGISGGVFDRPALQKLFTLIRGSDKKINVLVDSINRVARDIVIHRKIMELVKSLGAELIFTNMKLEDTAEGHMLESIMAVTAEYEREANKQRVLRMMKARIESGYWTFGFPPGYKFDEVPGHGRLLVRDEPKATIIIQAIEGYATRRFLTQSDVRNFLQSKKFHHRGKPGVVHLEQVKRMLTQILYTGKIEYLKWGVLLRDGHHEPLISYATYLKVQQRLKEKVKEFANYDISKDSPLRGFLLCAKCGRPFTASWSKNHSGKRFPYYRCNTPGCEFKNKSINRNTVHDEFHQLLKLSKPNIKIQNLLKKIVKEQYDIRVKEHSKSLNNNKKKAKELDTIIDSLVDRMSKCYEDLVIRRLEQKIANLERQRQLLEFESHGAKNSFPVFETAFDTVAIFIHNIDREWHKGDLRQKKMVQYLVFPECIPYTKGKGFGTAPKSLLFELTGRNGSDKVGLVEVAGIEPASQRSDQ
jgi:site-specific DNA recombinase